MRNSLLLVLFAGVIASGCFIVTDDKPANSAPAASTATAPPTASAAPRPRLRKAPPPPMPDGGF